MKTRYSIMFVFCAVLLGWSQAQSSFILANRLVWDSVDAPVFDGAGRPLDGTEYRAELYGGTTQDSLSPLYDLRIWEGSRERVRLALPFASHGYLVNTPGRNTVVSPDVSSGAVLWLQLRAWETRVGDTYEAAVARGLGGYGESALFRKGGGDPGGSLPALPEPLIGLQSFRLLPVIPEPSTWLLLAVGGVLMRWVVRTRSLG